MTILDQTNLYILFRYNILGSIFKLLSIESVI